MTADTGTERTCAVSAFADALRAAIAHRRVSLRALQRRLGDRGHDISVATLSMWQSGARRPEKDTSLDVVAELERLLDLDDGELAASLGPSRRVRPTRYRSYAALSELPAHPLTEEPQPELLERSGAILLHLDRAGRIARTVNRTVWQAAVDGARDATVFYGLRDEVAPEIRGSIGCDLVDTVVDLDLQLLRTTLRLHAPLRQGEIVMTERESTNAPGSAPDETFTLVAPRRQAEVALHAVFDPAAPPRRCRVIVDSEESSRSHTVPINGTCVTHAESGCGPATMTMVWAL